MMDEKYKQYKKFDLTHKRPQVLLIGNGLSRRVDWKQFIEAVSIKDIEKYYKDKEPQLPNLILTSTVTDINDSVRQNQYIKSLDDYICNPSEQIKNLLNINFDAILTTNYTYELEYNLKSNYCSITDNTKREMYAKTTESEYDSKYFIHTFNRVSNGELSQDIWHIHGEQRRKSSLVLTHDEYARLMGKIIEYNNKIGNKYDYYYDNLKFKSWIDYFVMGDLYILGQGFDFAEFDLWWLLLRRIREKAKTGKIIFYEPQNEDNKYKLLALEDLGVKTETLECIIDKSKNINEQYKYFYDMAIKDIHQKVLNNQEEI